MVTGQQSQGLTAPWEHKGEDTCFRADYEKFQKGRNVKVQSVKMSNKESSWEETGKRSRICKDSAIWTHLSSARPCNILSSFPLAHLSRAKHRRFFINNSWQRLISWIWHINVKSFSLVICRNYHNLHRAPNSGFTLFTTMEWSP